LVLTQGDTTTSRSLLEESLRLSSEIGIQWGIAESLAGLAQVEVSQGNLAAARMLYEKCLAIEGEWKYKDLLPSCLEGLADVVGVQGEPAWAARLLGSAEALRKTMGTPLPPFYRAEYERSIATVRAQLGEKAFAAAWAEGRTMTPDQALFAQGPATILSPPPTVRPSVPPTKLSTYPSDLTRRELEVLRLVAQGLTDAEVAERLVISPHTVHVHTSTIYSKLEVKTRSAATRYAFEHNLV